MEFFNKNDGFFVKFWDFQGKCGEKANNYETARYDELSGEAEPLTKNDWHILGFW